MATKQKRDNSNSIEQQLQDAMPVPRLPDPILNAPSAFAGVVVRDGSKMLEDALSNISMKKDADDDFKKIEGSIG